MNEAPFDFDLLWDYGKPAESEIRFRALLDSENAQTNPTYRFELFTQIARALGLRRKFTEAHALLDSIAPEIANTAPRAKVRYLLERGRAFNSSGEREPARKLFEEAFTLAHDTGEDFFAVDAAHMVAIASDGEEKFLWNNRGIAIAQASDDTRARNWRGSLLNNLGWDYFALARYDEALSCFEQALASRITQENPTEIRIARWSIAKTLRMQNRLSEALAIQRELLAEIEREKVEPDGFVFEELGEIMLAQGSADSERPYFRQAHELLSNDIWLIANEPARLERLRTLGEAARER